MVYEGKLAIAVEVAGFSIGLSRVRAVFQRRQLLFSNLLPCSTKSAQRERTINHIGQHCDGAVDM